MFSPHILPILGMFSPHVFLHTFLFTKFLLYSVIHHWKALNLSLFMIFLKKIFCESCKASEFWWRIRTDVFPYTETSSSSWPSSYQSPITLILIIVMVFVYTKLDRSTVHQTNSKLTHWPNSKKIAKMWPNLGPTNLFYIWVVVQLKNTHFCICIFVFIFYLHQI